MNMLYFRQ